MKYCIVCNTKQSLHNFRLYKRPTSVFYSKKCRPCLALEKKAWVKTNFDRNNERNKAYNKKFARRIWGMKLVKNYWPELTWEKAIEEWEKMKHEQNGLCYFGHTTKKLHVDHCHKTGRVRRLLCYNCNNGIGRLKEDVALLSNIIIYLNKFVEIQRENDETL